MRTSFYEFIKEQIYRDDSIGDFANDTLRVEVAPITSNSKEGWRGYLVFKGACPEAMSAFYAAWKEYKTIQKIEKELC